MTISTHFAAGGFATCYLVGPDGGGYGVLIDPGYLNAALLGHIEQRNLPPRAVLLTHAHYRHCAGAAAIQKVFGAEIYAAAAFAELPTNVIAGGQEVRIGALTFEVLSTPGHSADSVCYAVLPVIFTGDTLAAGTVGSAATPEARATLRCSVRERLLSRADHEVVLPGHGPPTTIGVERRFNIHLQG